MRAILLFSFMIGIMCNACTINDPKKDGIAVCKCYDEIDTNGEDAARSASIRKCIGLYGDLMMKYKEKPSQLMEFVSYTDSCSKDK